jgi:pimeloyl-ACP methyl ester carboxylesterase
MNDASVLLPDGRRLGYTAAGADDGPTTLYFHGTPGSRLLPPAADELGLKYGLRIIGVDRPGFGLSDFQPGRRISDWPADVQALLDDLGLERAGLLGVSSGGPYVLSCCHSIPERVSRALIVGGLTDAERPALISDASAVPRVLLVALRRSSLLRRAVYRFLGTGMRKNPDRVRRELARGLSASDGKVLEKPDVGLYICAAGAEGARNGGRGWAYDDGLLSESWDFSAAEISEDVPIDLWYGDDDLAVTPASAKRIAHAIASANLKVFPGEGHMLVFDHVEDAVRLFMQP